MGWLDGADSQDSHQAPACVLAVRPFHSSHWASWPPSCPCAPPAQLAVQAGQRQRLASLPSQPTSLPTGTCHFHALLLCSWPFKWDSSSGGFASAAGVFLEGEQDGEMEVRSFIEVQLKQVLLLASLEANVLSWEAGRVGR